MRTVVALALIGLAGCGDVMGSADGVLVTPIASGPAEPPPPVLPVATPPPGSGTPATVDAGSAVDAGEPPEVDAGAAPIDAGPSVGVMTHPRFGDVFDGDISQATLTVEGVSPRSGELITIEVLGPPYDATGWVTLAQTNCDSTLGSGRYADGYHFSIDVQPGAAWLQGGVLSLRARDSLGQILSSFEYDAGDCIGNLPGVTYQQLVGACGSTLPDRVVVVSSGPTPADLSPGPRYLDGKGSVDEQGTADYYAAINAPSTLDDFRSQFGFDQPGEATATYFNAGDLGIGREMHCVPLSPGLACYVRNYGAFGGDPGDALSAAVAGASSGGSGSFAAVVMVYQPGASEPIRFIVYGADGTLSNSAQLDSHGDNTSIPNNCLACHGLRGSYDPQAQHVDGASFLGFNPAAFSFADQAPYRWVDQLGQLQVLNQLVLGADASATAQALIHGDYLGAAVATDGSLVAPIGVPAGWQGSAADARVYREVVQPLCQGCHATQAMTGGAAYSTATDLMASAPTIAARVCGTTGNAASHDMPNAEVPLRRLWSGPARAYLVGYLGLATPCAP